MFDIYKMVLESMIGVPITKYKISKNTLNDVTYIDIMVQTKQQINQIEINISYDNSEFSYLNDGNI